MNYKFIEIKERDEKYYYIKLKYIPRDLFEGCLNVLKAFECKYISDIKSWKTEINKIHEINKSIEDFIYDFEDNNNSLISENLINIINNELNKIKDFNKKLEISNDCLKFFKNLSIELNKKIYEA
jgi:hypothetical protein